MAASVTASKRVGPKDPVVEDIERGLTRLIRRANLPRVHDRLMSRAGVSIERAAYLVLTRIGEHEPVRLSEVSQLLGTDISTVSRQVKDLADAGLVTRTAEAGDRRAYALRLTGEGRRLLRRIRAARHESLTALLASWSEDDRVDLAALINRLVDDLSTLWDEPG